MKIVRTIVRISILLVFFITGFVSGCSTIPKGPTDSVLNTYVDSFVEEMNFHPDVMDGFSVNFRTMRVSAKDNKRVVGICNRYRKHIAIDPTFFYDKSESSKRKTALIYHELAHCICYSNHQDDKMEDGCPTTMMNSMLPANKCLQKHWNYYTKELYKRCE